MPRATASAGRGFDLTRRQGRAPQRGQHRGTTRLQTAQIQILGPQTRGCRLRLPGCGEGHARHAGLRQVERADRAVGDEQVCDARRRRGDVVDAHSAQLDLVEIGVGEIQGADRPTGARRTRRRPGRRAPVAPPSPAGPRSLARPRSRRAASDRGARARRRDRHSVIAACAASVCGSSAVHRTWKKSRRARAAAVLEPRRRSGAGDAGRAEEPGGPSPHATGPRRCG